MVKRQDAAPIATNQHLVPRAVPVPVEEIAAGYLAGATIRALATRFGVSDRPVRRALKEAGITARRPGKGHPSEEELAAIVKAWQQGMTMRQIALKFGRGINSVRTALDRGGVPPRTSGRQNPLRGREAAVAADYRAGATIQGLESKYGSSNKTIRAAIVSQGVKIRPTGSRPSRRE